MSDSSQPNTRPKGFSNLIRHMTSDYVGVGLWLTRIITVLLAVFGYVLPLGVFGDPVACCKIFFCPMVILKSKVSHFSRL